jgi:hypothetical protein
LTGSSRSALSVIDVQRRDINEHAFNAQKVSERNPTKLLLMKTLIAVAVVIIALQRVAIFAGTDFLGKTSDIGMNQRLEAQVLQQSDFILGFALLEFDKDFDASPPDFVLSTG